MNNEMFGWVDDPKAVESVMKELPFPVFGDAWEPIKDTGKGKTVLLYKVIETVAKTFPMRKQTIGDCLNPSALVKMADGIEKPIVDIQIGEFVMTPFGNIKRVTDKIVKPYNGKMVRVFVKGYDYPIELTPDHLCIELPNVKRGNKKDRDFINWKSIISFKEGDKILLPKMLSYLDVTYDLSKLFDVINEKSDFKNLRTCPVPTGFVRAKGSNTNVKRFIKLDDKLSWLIGLFAAEGSHDNSRITFNLSNNEILIAKKIEHYVKEIFGVETKIYQVPSKPSVLYARISNKIVSKFFNFIVNGNTYTKKLHKDLLVANEQVKIGILDGWLTGDGWKNKIGVSVNKTLIDNMFDISLSLGISPTITRRKSRNRSKESYSLNVNASTIIHTQSGYELKLASKNMVKNGKAATISKIEIVNPETDKVYCLVVEDDHSFIANRFAVHNCVSQGAAYAVDAIKAVDIYLHKQFEEWVAETATEDIYAGSRVQIGGGKIGNGDGSVGAWAADYITKFGALPRQKYGNLDLSVYDGNKARQWGRSGVPKDLIPFAKEHPVQIVSRVDTYEQARDLLANGYAITIASMQGFSNRRDAEGFAKPEGQWAHQMSILAIDDEYKRPAVLVQNSWGVWNGGPKRHEQPDGSFWVDADVIEKRIFSQGDSWAFSGYEGFKPRKLNTRII